eukprot:1449170-Rhodomonas_salina.2
MPNYRTARRRRVGHRAHPVEGLEAPVLGLAAAFRRMLPVVPAYPLSEPDFPFQTRSSTGLPVPYPQQTRTRSEAA